MKKIITILIIGFILILGTLYLINKNNQKIVEVEEIINNNNIENPWDNYECPSGICKG